MGDCCTISSTQIKDLGARLDIYVFNTSMDSSGNLGSKRIPYAVFFFALGCVDCDTFFSVDRITRCEVESGESIIFSFDDKYAWMTMRNDNYF
jgi:hypothetical protein